MTLRLGLPSKGRLREQAADWFAARGIALAGAGGGREYALRVGGLPGLEAVLLPAAEIPGELARGRLHLGVTGQDLVREAIPVWEGRVEELAPLGFGRADLVLAVPAAWVDVTTLDDLDAVAAAFRARHGFRLRIATKYRRLVRAYLAAQGVGDYRIVPSEGATEATVRNGSAEAIADITTTGATLRDNHLRALADGPILASEAVLFRARAAAWDEATRATLARLRARLGLADAPA